MKLVSSLAIVFSFCLVDLQLAARQSTVAPDEKAAAREFLDQYWPRDQSTRRAAENAYKAIEKAGSSSGHIEMAYAVNRIHFDQFREAKAVSQGLTEKFPEDWDAWHLQIWTEMSVGNCNEALVLMQQMKKAVNANSDVDETQKFTIYSRLGRLYAFAEGPGREKARPETLVSTLATITDGLDDTDLGSFEDQRSQTDRMYTSMLDEKSNNVTEQVQKSAADEAKTLQQVTAENQVISERQTQLQMEGTAIRERAESETGQLRSRAAPLQSDLALIDSRIFDEQNRAALIANDVASYLHAAENEIDPHRQHHLYELAAAAQFALTNQQRLVGNLRSQFDAIASQLNVINSEIAATENRFGSQLRGLEGESRQLTGRLKKNSRTISKLGDPKPESGYIKRVDSQLARLATFDPFPVEEFRQRLLDELK